MIKLPINIDYSGKVVVITGAGGLICGAMARAFAQSKAKVAALDLNGEAVITQKPLSIMNITTRHRQTKNPFSI